MPWFTSFSIQAGLHSCFFLLVQCFRFWLFVQSSAQSSDKYFSFFARGGCYGSKQILGLEESCPERSWLASRCQSMARRGNKKPNKPANTKTPPNRRNHHHQRTRHMMFTKHRLWEIPAGKTMKYTHTISKHTACYNKVSSTSEYQNSARLPCIPFGTSLSLLKPVWPHACSTDYTRAAVRWGKRGIQSPFHQVYEA